MGMFAAVPDARPVYASDSSTFTQAWKAAACIPSWVCVKGRRSLDDCPNINETELVSPEHGNPSRPSRSEGGKQLPKAGLWLSV